MPTYAMLTRLSPEALQRPESVVDLNRRVEDRIKPIMREFREEISP